MDGLDVESRIFVTWLEKHYEMMLNGKCVVAYIEKQNQKIMILRQFTAIKTWTLDLRYQGIGKMVQRKYTSK